jgi:ribA/ribD-fused uncharacterized protein
MIKTFDGENAFLSNFAHAEMVWDNIVWPTSEHAYQAAKSLDRDVRLTFSRMKSPGVAKRAGKHVLLRPDWESVKVDLMKEIVRAKFEQNPDLKQRLIATAGQHLEEGNWWNDKFWGVCPAGSSNGKNMLGKILMELRDEWL